MDEENKIQDGEIISGEETPFESKKKKRKTDLYIELVLFFILGLLLGITLKTEANKRITIGYNDYRMDIRKSDYDINKLQVDLAQKAAQESAAGQQDQPESAQNQESSPDQDSSGGAIAPPGQNSQNQ